jgi:hypothetical protein
MVSTDFVVSPALRGTENEVARSRVLMIQEAVSAALLTSKRSFPLHVYLPLRAPSPVFKSKRGIKPHPPVTFLGAALSLDRISIDYLSSLLALPPVMVEAAIHSQIRDLEGVF